MFFALGKCTRGQTCNFNHEVAAGLSPEAAPFVPPPKSADSLVSPSKTNGIPCRFHLLGRCNKGTECPYKHFSSAPNEKQKLQPRGIEDPPGPIPVQDTKTDTCPMSASEQSTGELETRNLRGASVVFGPGAQVQEFEFPSDYSAAQVTSLRMDWDAEAFQRFLASLGESVPLSSIRVKTVTKPPSIVANARTRDPGFAHRLKLKADAGVKGFDIPDIAIRVLQVGIKSDSSANRLQMNTVSCTWYKPSRTAWLHYNNTGKARAAETFIASRNFKIAGRKIQATLQIPENRFRENRFRNGKSTITSVHLGNLDASTSRTMIGGHIPGHLAPVDVIMGKISYSASLHEAEEAVKTLLDGIGPLAAWEPISTMSATQVKAVARFQTGECARAAVHHLSGRKMPQLANSKLFVSPLISVKFNFPKAIYSVIRGDIDHLKAQLWEAGHVHIKAYPPVDPTQKLIALRLYGEEVKAVAKAKSAFEKILAGDVALNGNSGMWNIYFTRPEGLAYLNGLSHTHQGYIYSDMRNHRLSLYGSADTKELIRRALIEKLDSLTEMTHCISLSADELKRALQGGFRRIIATLGKQNAVLDIRRRPQIITIIGSPHDVETARALLDQDVACDLEDLALNKATAQPDCAVCWTEAEDAYRTSCGHSYCGDCFASQCSSAGEGDLPVRCFGDSGKCLKVLEIQEIKNGLTSAAFEQLLEDSFTTHVRMNPKSFQYCPTPDCQQIYRTSPDGIIFTCPACLTPICTTCQITSHDGMTCEVYKRIGTEGDEEFQRWKQENDVKDCPICKVPIEKSEGCNHMECRNCKTHICWFCLETFDEGRKCYGHMQEVHGNFYAE